MRTFGLSVDEATRAHVRKSLGTKLGKFARHIERLTVRFTDVNGPRGGKDVECDIKVVLSGQRSVVYKMRGHEPRETLDRAAPGIVRAVQSALTRTSTGRAARTAQTAKRPARAKKGATAKRLPHPSPEGSFIGRRVGRGAANLEAALERPEKTRRDFPVDTAEPGRSATDRKAGGGSTARRNTRRRISRATATLEDSALERPTRKPTRKGTNRAKQGSKLQRRQVRKTTQPKARATRARASKANPR